ncbi:MAG TPA: hypothetical protein VI997_09030 [Candidatus Thermoplasmatota archaeon]|nr:hypothetical protein [Candidatus Thermoplasmatota archaeon]
MAVTFDGPYDWTYATFLVAWAISAAFGLLVVAFRWKHLPSRALGIAQGLTSFVGVGVGMAYLERDPAATAWWMLRFTAFFAIMRPFLWVYFTWSFPRPRGIAASPRRLALLFGPMAAIYVAFILDPSWMTINVLWVFTMTGYLMGAVMSVVFFHEFLKFPTGPLRESLFLMSVGWLPGTSLVGAYYMVTRFTPDPLMFVSAVLGGLMLYAYFYLVWRFLRHEHAAGERFEPWRRWLFFAFPLSALAASLTGLALHFLVGHDQGHAVEMVVDAVWCAAGVLLITYGIMKYQLLGIDLRLKWTIKQSTVAAAFVAVFFVASEATQQVFAARVGPILGLAAAGALVFAIAPLERLAGRVSEAAMPGVKPISQMGASERALLYLEQARFAWGDGQLSVKDRQILEVARNRLGLTRDEVARLEEEAMGLERRSGGAPSTTAG